MQIPGYSRYDITRDGVVTERSTGQRVKPYTNNSTVLVRVRADGHTEKQAVTVNRLLALTFIGPCPDGCVAAYKEGTTLSADNVEWTSRRDLSIRTRHLVAPKASVVGRLKSTQAVYDGLLQCKEPITMTGLSTKLSMPYSTVRYAIYGLMAVGKARAVEGGYEAI